MALVDNGQAISIGVHRMVSLLLALPPDAKLLIPAPVTLLMVMDSNKDVVGTIDMVVEVFVAGADLWPG